MKRVFLSHSSEDKQKYLDIVVKNLTKTIGRDKFVYDAITFEEGEETNLEISNWLERSEIFVLFISENALGSPWVQKEILEAKDLYDNKILRKIFPIIIDNTINHEDSRLPDWMREIYNIRYIGQPSVAARKIYNKIIEISWERNPNMREKSTLFAGRNNLINEIEERMDSFEKSLPTSLIASGLKDIGRRSLLRRSLVKSTVINDSYIMPDVILDAHQSIEDFILLLKDLGYGQEISGENLIKLSQEEKIDRAFTILKEIKDSKDVLLIVDEGAVVSPVREISEWFIKLNIKLAQENVGVVMCLVSKYKTRYQDLNRAESIYAIHVPELSASEAKGLFTRYSRIINLDLSIGDIKFITAFFSGLPKEIIYTADYIEHHSVAELRRSPGIITDYSDNQVSRLISQYETDANARNMLALIATFDFISYSMLFEIIDNNHEYNHLIEEFLSQGICENLGVDGEYICLNSAIKNYIQRQKFKVNEKFRNEIDKHVHLFVTDHNMEEGRDVSDIFFSLRRAIIGNLNIDNRLLIPSHYLKSMKELYDRKDKDQDVVALADRILENEEFMDEHISREIRYFLCSSLARLKKDRFKEEVQKIKGPEHNFLFGFYYRHVGRNDEAINSLLKALKERPNFSRAKRELVLVYNNLEEYDKALELAKENYEQNRNNEFHIHAYFQCLSYDRSDRLSFQERKNNITVLLEDMEKIDSEKAKNMLSIMSAQFYLYFEEDIEKAESLIQKAADIYYNDVFVLLCMFDVYEKKGDLSKLNEILQSLKIIHGNSSSKYHRDYLKCLAIYRAFQGELEDSQKIIRNINISESSKRNLNNRVEKIFKNSISASY